MRGLAYNNDVLLDTIANILPITVEEWKLIAIGYQAVTGEITTRNPAQLKRYFNEKLCGKKLRGAAKPSRMMKTALAIAQQMEHKEFGHSKEDHEVAEALSNLTNNGEIVGSCGGVSSGSSMSLPASISGFADASSFPGLADCLTAVPVIPAVSAVPVPPGGLTNRRHMDMMKTMQQNTLMMIMLQQQNAMMLSMMNSAMQNQSDPPSPPSV